MFNWKKTNCHTILALVSVMCTIIFRGVTCQENAISSTSHNISKESIPVVMRGDAIHPTSAAPAYTSQDVVEFPILANIPLTVDEEKSTESMESSKGSSPNDKHTTPPSNHATSDANSRSTQINNVVCVDEASVRNKDAVKLKLMNASSCDENKAKIQSILEHLCGENRMLEIYQKDHTDEMIISGACVKDDVKGMTDKFDNDNIKDKVGVVEAEPILVNHSQVVLISVLISGLLLAVMLIAAYILKTRHTEDKGTRLAEEMFQVDEQNQGNTLLSVAPLPPQEPVEKPSSNGESLESPPTNGHSATQTPVADSEM